MPIYLLACECGAEVEKICSFEASNNVICECGRLMTRKPSHGGCFHVNGYSFANGYSREELSYDGRTPDAW